MDEQQWLSCTDSRLMLEQLENKRYGSPTDRKLRLFACACARQNWQLLTDKKGHKAVEIAEKFVDGQATIGEMQLACRDVEYIQYSYWDLSCSPVEQDRWCDKFWSSLCWCCAASTEVPLHYVQLSQYQLSTVVSLAAQADLLRDIFGNPFRKANVPTIETSCSHCGSAQCSHDSGECSCRDCGADAWLSSQEWLTPTVVSIASRAYEERGRKCLACNQWTDCKWCQNTRRIDDGSLDPVALAVLADALEESGCEDEDILKHCRGKQRCSTCLGKGVEFLDLDPYSVALGGLSPTGTCSVCGGQGWVNSGLHYRGCHVVDLLLGKN